MKKRKMMVMVTAIALAIACTHHSIKKIKTKKSSPEKQVVAPYVPSVFIDVSLFPGNFYQFLVIYL
jgi:hypothetical protein